MTDRTTFDRVWPWLAEAMTSGGDTHSKDDIWEMVESGEATLWASARSAAITEIIQNPRKVWMNVWLAGGNLEELLTILLPQAEESARQQGITEMWAWGRLGWIKALKQEGFTHVTAVVKKVL